MAAKLTGHLRTPEHLMAKAMVSWNDTKFLCLFMFHSAMAISLHPPISPSCQIPEEMPLKEESDLGSPTRNLCLFNLSSCPPYGLKR